MEGNIMNYTAIQMAKKLDISRSYLYYLKDSKVVEVAVNENGKVLWTDAVYEKLKEYIKKNQLKEKLEIKPSYKTIKINNRRYLGNKYKLLPFITEVVKTECKNVNIVADIFAGTGAVASAFTDKKLIINDNMYSNYICHVAWFSSEPYSKEKIVELVQRYNDTLVTTDNYMSENFANTYFSLEDCRKIGYIREDIEQKYSRGELIHTYYLRSIKRMGNTCIFNEKYAGYSFLAKVIEIREDKVKIILDGDENENQNNSQWFPYSTGYSSPDGSGWYCMPEIGDRVRLQLPDSKEEHAYVISAVHMPADKGRKNPDFKSFKTKYGKELLFMPDSIKLTNNKGMSIKISDRNGISIKSNKNISITAKENLTISSEDSALTIVGSESVDITQAKAGLYLEQDVTFTGGKFRIQ